MKKVLILWLLVGLVGCNKLESQAKKAVESQLKDPDSAKFQNLDGICGEVNAKNSFGAYGGFKKFIDTGDGVIFSPNLEDSADDKALFKERWDIVCTNGLTGTYTERIEQKKKDTEKALENSKKQRDILAKKCDEGVRKIQHFESINDKKSVEKYGHIAQKDCNDALDIAKKTQDLVYESLRLIAY